MPSNAIERWEWEGGFVETESAGQNRTEHDRGPNAPKEHRDSAASGASRSDTENESDASPSHDPESHTNDSSV
jgi:hypothetical protein